MPPQDQLQPSIVRPSSEKWARRFFLAGLVLLPLFIIPVLGFPFALAKVSLFATLVALGVVSLGVFSFKTGALRVPFGKVARLVGLLVGAYVVSTILSQDWKLSLAGTGTETDTLLFIALAALTFFVSSALFRTRESAKTFFSTLYVGVALVALFQLVRIFGSKLFASSVFSTVSSNLVGTWNDFGIIVAILAVLSVVALDIRRNRGVQMLVSAGLLFLSLALLAVVNFAVLWWLLMAAMAAIAFASLREVSADAYTEGAAFSVARIPFAAVLVALVSGVFLMWGSSIAPKIQKIAPVSEVDVQLTYQTAIEVTRTTYAQSALTTFFGSGPNTFSQQWLIYKPASLTNSQFWTLDFSSGFSSILTAFLTGGLVVGILFVLIPVFALLLFIRKVGTVREPEKKETVITAAALSVLLLGAMCFYVPGQVVVLLAFAVLGVFTAWLGSDAELVLPAGRGRLLGTGSIVVLMAIALVCAGALLHRFSGSYYEGKALTAASAGNISLAEKYGMRAVSLYRSESALHLMATIKFNQAQSIAAETDKATESTRAQRFQTTFADASNYATAATTEYPKHWANWLTLAQLYEALIPLKVENAYQQSESAYTNAITLSPRNPQLYLMAARMEASANNEQSARNAVSQALTLKQNYTDAILFVVQLEIAKNNIDAALNAAAAAVQTAPDNAGLWVQLGMLAYNKKDDKVAAAAFERALTLQGDYANAKYFLGLVYYRQGKVGDAAALFEDLARTNPDNQEIAGIRAAIQAGKPLFPEQAETPKTAPVKDK